MCQFLIKSKLDVSHYITKCKTTITTKYLRTIPWFHLTSSFEDFEKSKQFLQNLHDSLHDKTEYVIHIRNLKQAINHGLVFKKVHRVIKFNQNAFLNPYVDMNTDLRKKAKNDFEKDFF